MRRGAEPPLTIGLWGDGDEIAAIRFAEERLKTKLDYSEAQGWFTVGDLFESFCRANPALLGSRVAWRRLCVALCQETGVSPRLVRADTALIQRWSMWKQIAFLLRGIGFGRGEAA